MYRNTLLAYYRHKYISCQVRTIIRKAILPDIVVLAKLHANQENKERRKEVQHLKEMLKEGNRKPIDGNTSDKIIEMKKEKHIEQKSSNTPFSGSGCNKKKKQYNTLSLI